MKKLTAAKIAALTTPGRFATGGNLYIRVRDSGSKTWTFYYRFQGEMHDLGLGVYPEVSIKEARAKADEGNRLLRAGQNPKVVWDERKRASGTPTFGTMAERYLAGNKAAQWRSDRHRTQVAANLLRHCGNLSNLRVDEITTEHVLATLKGRSKGTAHRVRGDIYRVLGAAQALGHIPDNVRNAAQWRGGLDQLMAKPPAAKHHEAMPYIEVGAFLERLRERRQDVDGKPCVAAYALEFTILCGARSKEVRLATWDEIDIDGKLWSLTGPRMKAGKPHCVPLSDGALAILDVMRELRTPPTGDYVFPGFKPRAPLTGKSFERLLKRMGCKFVTHGFRSSLRNWSHCETHFENVVCEQALAHDPGSASERAYRRDLPVSKLRQLFAAWDAYLAPRPDNVVQLRSA